MITRLWLLVLLCAVTRVQADPTTGASPATSSAPPPLPLLGVPHAAVAPRLDASADDPAWRGGAVIEAMTSSIIPDGKTSRVPATQVRVLWDKDYVYVRFVCTDAEIFTPFTERDALHYQGDVVEAFVDPVGDGRHYYEFQLSARGGILDQYIVISTEPRTDQYGCLLPEIRLRDYWDNLAWNCEGLRTATRILQDKERDIGWIAELALPAKTLLRRTGQTTFAPGPLRANFLRYDWPLRAGGKRELVAQNWSPVLFGSPHKSAARMGFLQLKAPE